MRVNTCKSIRDYLRKLVSEDTDTWQSISNDERDRLIKLRGVVVGEIEKALTKNFITEVPTWRRSILGLLFLPENYELAEMSSKDLSPAEIKALARWVGSQKVDDEWKVREPFHIEVVRFFNRVVYYQDYERLHDKKFPISELITEIYSLEIGTFAETAYKMGMISEAIKLGGEPVEIDNRIRFRESKVELKPPIKPVIEDDIVKRVYGGVVMI